MMSVSSEQLSCWHAPVSLYSRHLWPLMYVTILVVAVSMPSRNAVFAMMAAFSAMSSDCALVNGLVICW